jgi:hypothetical protein
MLENDLSAFLYHPAAFHAIEIETRFVHNVSPKSRIPDDNGGRASAI